MSAITEQTGISGIPGVHSYQTKIKVVVHSHNAREALYLSDDVFSCMVGKNIKGVGRANIAVVARLNYLNLIFPNDVINIYFLRNDGQGWIRTFFGYIDRIEEEYTVGDDGTPSTMYHIIASDFQKALEKTEIYFNPDLAGRRDIQGSDFATINIGGLSMITRGLTATGTPPDVVRTLLLLQLGFGSQWLLPTCYNPVVPQEYADQRKQYATRRLLRSMEHRLRPQQYHRLQNLVESGEIERLRQESINSATTDPVNEAATGNLEEETQQAMRDAGMDPELAPDAIGGIGAHDQRSAALLNFNRRVVSAIAGGAQEDPLSLRTAELNTYFNAMTNPLGENSALLDVLDIFNFVERSAMDGYTFDLGIWDRQGSLMNITRGASNEVVNELFFDLRPMNTGSVLQEGTDWDRSGDELLENLADDISKEDGIRYVPALVMREYPFATVPSVDARNIAIGLRGSQLNTPGAGENFGVLHFGAIFSNKPNEPGRHIVTIPNINVEDRAEASQALATTGLTANAFDGTNLARSASKHLDVAVVHETEIKSTRFGRSDEDHFNLFAMWTDNALGSSHKFMLKDFMPIITPIHILRNGLRVREVSSRFSRFDLRTVNLTQPQAETQEPQETATEPEETAEESITNRALGAPVGAPPAGKSVRISSVYGYRKSSSRSSAHFWHFHNGIDIAPGGGGVGDETVDIVAIADGEIIVSAASGTPRFGGYGNYIAIEHPQFTSDSGRPIISVYAHLSSRNIAVVGNPSSSRNLRDCVAQGYCPATANRSNFEKIRVRKGDVLGKMGRTAGTRSEPTRIFSDTRVPHLHFEICTTGHLPVKGPATPDIGYTEADRAARAAIAGNFVAPFISAGPPAAAPASPPDTGNSTDPEGWFATQGSNLRTLLIEVSTGTAPADETTAEDEGGGEDAVTDEQAAPSRSDTDSTDDVADTQATTRSSALQLRGVVSDDDSRRQLGRWALLQDHWYQHNLEYLSGQVVMRGAPEIRVGYRLDLVERNLSFYVEGVQHNWQFPNEMTTTIQVTRGQPNNPYPAYALPPTPGFNTRESARRRESRLADYFVITDPVSVRKNITFRDRTVLNQDYTQTLPRQTGTYTPAVENALDNPDNWGPDGFNYGELPEGLIAAESYQTEQVPPGLAEEDEAAAEISAQEGANEEGESPDLANTTGTLSEQSLNTLENL